MLGLVTAVSAVGFAQTYNYADDFSISNGNPNGVWTYGYTQLLGGSFTPHASTVTGDTIWWQTDLGLGVPANFKNNGVTNGPGGLLPGEAAIHPGFDPGQFGVARFTPPTAGLVTISGSFGQGDAGAVEVHILKNGISLFSVIETFDMQSFSLSTSLDVTDTLDFVVGRSDIIFFDTTPLDATVVLTPVPEPASMAALGLGAVGLIRRRNRKSITS